MSNYDPAKVRQHLQILGAHASNPAFPYIEDMATMLKAAEENIVEAITARRTAENEANRYSAELETANATIRRIRDENAKLANEVEALKPKPSPKAKRAPKELPGTSENVVPLVVLAQEKAAAPAPAPKVSKKAK